MGFLDVPDTLDERQLKAVEILATPNHAGLSFEEIAEQCGVSVRTLHRWRSRQDFKDAIASKAVGNIKQYLPGVIEANVKQAMRGSAKHIELLYKLAGLLIDRSEVKTTDETKRDNANIEKDIDRLTHLLDEKNKEQDARVN